MNSITLTMFDNPFIDLMLLFLAAVIAIRIVLWILGKH